MEDSGTGDSTSADTAGQDTAGTGRRRARRRRAGHAGQERRSPQGLARYARPALIAGAVIAVVCIALLVIIFFLDSFNATVYSVGGKNVQDATDEARAIRDTYAAARLGGIIFLIAGVLLAAAGAVLMYRHRNDEGQDRDEDDGEDVDFEDLAGAVATRRPAARGLRRVAEHRPPAGDAKATGHVHSAPQSSPAPRRWTCPSLGAGSEHDAHVSAAPRRRMGMSPGGSVHPERISGTRLDRVLTIYIESSLALSLGGC